MSSRLDRPASASIRRSGQFDQFWQLLIVSFRWHEMRFGMSLLRRSIALTGVHARAATASLSEYDPPQEKPCTALYVHNGMCEPLFSGSCPFELCTELTEPGARCCTLFIVTCAVTECCCRQ